MRGDPDWDELAPPHLWWRALELVYEGNLAAAEAFFDEAWRPGKPGREEFRRMLFACKLRESPFWPDIAAMNGVEPVPPEGKCERLRELEARLRLGDGHAALAAVHPLDRQDQADRRPGDRYRQAAHIALVGQ